MLGLAGWRTGAQLQLGCTGTSAAPHATRRLLPRHLLVICKVLGSCVIPLVALKLSLRAPQCYSGRLQASRVQASKGPRARRAAGVLDRFCNTCAPLAAVHGDNRAPAEPLPSRGAHPGARAPLPRRPDNAGSQTLLYEALDRAPCDMSTWRRSFCLRRRHRCPSLPQRRRLAATSSRPSSVLQKRTDSAARHNSQHEPRRHSRRSRHRAGSRHRRGSGR